MPMTCRASRRTAGGFTLIEVLVTVALLLLGMLVTMGLQSKATVVELESYQRGQALTIARELAARIADSRSLVQTAGSGYLDASLSSVDGSVYVGVLGNGTTDLGTNCVNGTTPLAIATYEMCIWAKSLQGAAEPGSTGSMLGARGCLIRNATADGRLADMYIAVVWQGVRQGKEPLGTVPGEAPTPSSQCASPVDYGTGLRRGISLRVVVPNLQQP